MTRQTVDQRRAKDAWKRITSLSTGDEDGKRQYDDKAKEYAGEAKKLPGRIMGSGLGQALAFIAAKAKRGTKEEKKHLSQILDHLTHWVICQRPISAPKPESLLESIIAADSDFLRRATDESLAYLQWLNRFAEAEGLRQEE